MPTNKKSFLKRLLLFSYFIFSAFIVIIPAIYNRYPLFFSDSALYIDAAMIFGKNDQIKILSGIGYAFFIRSVTWKSTLWLVIYAQAVILNILIYLTIKVLLPKKNAIKYHLPLIFILTICSSMGWTVSQLMPDIFTSFLVLSIFLFFTIELKNWFILFFLSIIIIVSLLSHMSNISIIILFILALNILFYFNEKYKSIYKFFLKRTLFLIGFFIIALFILKGLNKKYYNENTLSPRGHIWFFARLIDTGFMQEYLNEKCSQKSFDICKYKDSLPDNSQTFLWGDNSVYYKTGGWSKNHNEYKEIINGVLTSPKYLSLFCFSCFKSTLEQITNFKIGDGLSEIYNRDSGPYQLVIKHYHKNEFKNEFQLSEQNCDRLKFDTINLINYVLLFFSILIIIYVFYTKKLDRNFHLFSFLIFCGIIFNAAVVSNLSTVVNRYQARVIWLIPLLAICYIYKFILPFLYKIYEKINKLFN